jgi:aspartate kinase
VDVQFVLSAKDMEPGITALHRALIEAEVAQVPREAA